MVNWVIIIAVALVAIILYNLKHFKSRFFLLFFSLFSLFLVITFSRLYSRYDLDLTSLNGLVTASKLYFSWLKYATANVIKVGGYAIKQDWSINATNLTK